MWIKFQYTHIPTHINTHSPHTYVYIGLDSLHLNQLLSDRTLNDNTMEESLIKIIKNKNRPKNVTTIVGLDASLSTGNSTNEISPISLNNKFLFTLQENTAEVEISDDDDDSVCFYIFLLFVWYTWMLTTTVAVRRP